MQMNGAPELKMKVYGRTRRIPRLALLLICFSPVAHGDQMLSTDRCASGIRGKVLLGPTCPVVTFPPNPNCDHKPYQVGIVVKSDSQKRDLSDAGKEVARFRSSSKGEFRACLPPGTYILESESSGVATLSFMRPQPVKVEPNKFATVTIHIDS